MRIAILVILGLVVLSSNEAQGQYYWVATTSPSTWNNALNWSNSSGGSGGFGIPGAGDRVIFDGAGGSHGDCILDMARTVNSITMNGYTGSIDLNGNNLTITSALNVTNTFATGTVTNSSTTALLTVTATANTSAQIFFSGTLFQAGVNVTANGSNLYLDGSTFFGTCSFIKWTGSVNTSAGGNTFNGPTTIGLNNTTGLEMNLTGSNPDVFNNSVMLIGASTSRLRVAFGAACTFNGNITLNAPSGVDNTLYGIFFGNGAGSGGSSVLASGQILSVITPFQGVLQIENFTQNGTEAVNLTLSSTTGHLVVFSSTFRGNFSADTRRLDLTGSVFNGTTNSFITRAAVAGLNSTTQGNTFGAAGVTSTTTFEKTTANTSNFLIGTGTGNDIYNSNVVFRYSGGGAACRVIPTASASNSYYFGNITWDNNSTGAMTFGAGVARFSGSTDQTINSIAGNATFGAIVMDKTGSGKVTLNTPMISSGNVNFIKGIIFSSLSANYVQMNSWSGVPSNNSHVDGPVQKVGTTAFTFPTGNIGMYGPVQITAPSTSSTFVARFVRSSARTMDADLGPGLAAVSDCEYWTLDRSVGTANVDVTLSWGLPSSTNCLITNTSELRVAQYDGSQWSDKGNNSAFISGNSTAGSIRSAAGSITSFAINQFALASSTLNNPLPIELIDFDGESYDDGVRLFWKTASEVNNDHFEIERSAHGLEFTEIASVPAKESFALMRNYEYVDRYPLSGKNYYRLKQIDFDGTATFLKIIRVDFAGKNELKVYPNPALSREKVSVNRKGNFLIVNSLGKVMMRQEQTDEFDSSTLMPGMYTLIFDDGNLVRFVIK